MAGTDKRRGEVRLRLADPSDGDALKRLAQLDSRPLPPGPFLLAERGGRIDAALSLHSGDTVADPFRHTAELCDLLRLHAGGLGAAGDEPRDQTVRTWLRLATA